MIKTADKICPESVEMRKAFCESLIELAGEDENVIVMDGDLMGAMGTKPFADEYPDQTLDCGIQEANAVGVAAGMSAVGKFHLSTHSDHLSAGEHAIKYLCPELTQG